MASLADLAAVLQKALKSQQMYGDSHPRAVDDLEHLHRAFTAWLEDSGTLQIAAAETRLLVDGVPFEGGTVHTAALHRMLRERALPGFVFMKGLRAEELRALLQLLRLKGERLEEAGGAAAFLEAQGVAHVRPTQARYLEVHEGEAAGPAPRESAPPLEERREAAPSAPPDVPPGAPPNLVVVVKEALRSTFGEPRNGDASGFFRIPRPALEGDGDGRPDPGPGPGPQPGSEPGAGAGPAGPGSVLQIIPAYLGDLGPMGYNIGLGEGMPTAAQMAVLRSALESLAPEAQLGMLAGLPTLPAKPQGLALGIKELAGEILGLATVGLLKRQVPWAHLQGVLQTILRPLPERDAMGRALAIHMREHGFDGDLAEGLLRHVRWEGMSLEARVVQVLEEGQLWAISLEQRLAFLRELLDTGRDDAFLRVLGLVTDALTAEDAAVRLVAAQTLRGVAPWAREPGLPPGAERDLAEKLKAHFAWEPTEPVHLHTSETLRLLLPLWVERGDLGETREFLGSLEALSALQGGDQPWRTWALEQARERLAAPDLLAKAYPRLFLPDRERVASESLPYFQWLGEGAIRYLVVALGQEGDRHWRGRLLELLRGTGAQAIPPLREALRSSAWYLVRNALNLLADVGDAACAEAVLPHLRHADGRVRRAAVRALWKLLGPACAPALGALLPDTDPETQMEILFGLGQAKAAESAAAVLALALDARAPEKLRLRAFDTLPLLGAATAVAPLAELFKRRKGLFGGAEPFEIRLAAAKALKGIGSPEARWALMKAVEAEPKGRERAAFEQVLAGFRPTT
ncbi:MAG: HEAT repeat domain-containing protein [Holophagaceae bacterium]